MILQQKIPICTSYKMLMLPRTISSGEGNMIFIRHLEYQFFPRDLEFGYSKATMLTQSY